MHMRREFVLSDGRHVLLGSTDMELDIVGETIATANGPQRVEQEVHGQEKNEALRPTDGVSRSFVA